MAKIINTVTGSEALTFDDVLLLPDSSEVIPGEVKINTSLGKGLDLNIPVISAAMDMVTGSKMAIAMAQAGGIGVIHRNFKAGNQSEHVVQVKKFEAGMVVNPLTIEPDNTLGQARELMNKHGFTGIPVVEKDGILIGILTNRDVRFARNNDEPVRNLMTYENLITVREDIKPDEARRLLHHHRIEKLLVVDEQRRCIGLITVKDMEKARLYPNACKDPVGRLRVAAAVGVGEKALKNVEILTNAGVDIVVVDTAHGHSIRVLDTVCKIRRKFKELFIIGGNVATQSGTKALIDAGVDAIKVGIGPGSICTTRIVAGVGVPQLSAIMASVEVAENFDIPVIADGGIRYSGDIAKALAAGARAVMVGSLLAGSDETPGEVYLHQGRRYKAYRGMGSTGAMARGSADRYFQEEIRESFKLVPEGVEGQVPYKGPVSDVLHQLTSGLRAAMGYIGAPDLAALRHKARFIRISRAAISEGHPHNVTITRESPNYPNS